MSIIENALGKLQRAGGPTAVTRLGPTAASDSQPGAETLPRRRIAIDLDALRAQGGMPEVDQAQRFADYYREIKRPLIEKALASDAGPHARLILVTSALPADGKTFTALNLALSIARERDVSVLLVDADLPKAHLSRAFGIEDEPGLLDALNSTALDVESLVLGTDIAGLEVLAAGKAKEGVAAELVGSARMAQVAAQLAGHRGRRLVLMDSSPLLVSSEARALKDIPGQILMIARAGKTPRHALLDAIALLDKTKPCTLVLNEAYETGAEGYYGYYGYSGYGASGDKSGPAG
jgi:protein-tyrosine kinase